MKHNANQLFPSDSFDRTGRGVRMRSGVRDLSRPSVTKATSPSMTKKNGKSESRRPLHPLPPTTTNTAAPTTITTTTKKAEAVVVSRGNQDEAAITKMAPRIAKSAGESSTKNLHRPPPRITFMAPPREENVEITRRVASTSGITDTKASTCATTSTGTSTCVTTSTGTSTSATTSTRVSTSATTTTKASTRAEVAAADWSTAMNVNRGDPIMKGLETRASTKNADTNESADTKEDMKKEIDETLAGKWSSQKNGIRERHVELIFAPILPLLLFPIMIRDERRDGRDVRDERRYGYVNPPSQFLIRPCLNSIVLG